MYGVNPRTDKGYQHECKKLTFEIHHDYERIQKHRTDQATRISNHVLIQKSAFQLASMWKAKYQRMLNLGKTEGK